MKRFTCTEKWDDPWFWELSDRAKLLWIYLLDHCDHAGVIDFNSKIASFKIGKPIEPQHLAELENRLKTLHCGKLWIPKFVRFQFGSLEATNNFHRSILKLIASHGLAYPEDWQKSSPSCAPLVPPSEGHKKGKECTDEGKDQEEERKGKGEPTQEMLRLNSLFKRRDGTAWSEKELKALKKISPIPEEDLALIEHYYGLAIPDGEFNCRRKSVEVLLNNWNGELDRARNYRPSVALKPGDAGYDWRKDPNHNYL